MVYRSTAHGRAFICQTRLRHRGALVGMDRDENDRAGRASFYEDDSPSDGLARDT